MKLNRKWLGIGLLVGLIATGVAYAKTANQILQAVYDSANTALRINVVAG